MDGIFWLVVAVLFSLVQCRSLWGDRRRLLEVWLRNLLGIAIGVRYLVAFGVTVSALSFEQLSPLSAGELITMAATFLGFAVAGLLCLYRKIFWFGLSVVVPFRAIPIGIANLYLLGFSADTAWLSAQFALSEVLVPGAILVLMALYYLQYVRVAK